MDVCHCLSHAFYVADFCLAALRSCYTIGSLILLSKEHTVPAAWSDSAAAAANRCLSGAVLCLDGNTI